MDKLLTLRETMAALNCSRSTVWNLIRAGRLHPVRLGPRTNRFRVAEVETIIDRPRESV